jgi:hypothetical protein
LGTYGNDCQLVHRATSTDDCTTISSQYNITQDTLLTNNPNVDCDQVYAGLMLCVVAGIIRPPSFTALNLTYFDEDATANATLPLNATQFVMPLGTAVVATNAVEAGPQTVQVVTVQASATTTSTSATQSSSTTAAAKRHVNLENRGHGHHHSNHNAAAKRYQMSQSDGALS